ncbi:hypothetical protein N7465_006932 [Penicillium sp. CMV-2018d]|nr:hypothetical protein N7465_006932 [Penicillium sp. CMV-2018d]
MISKQDCNEIGNGTLTLHWPVVRYLPEHTKSLLKRFKMPGGKAAPVKTPGLKPPHRTSRSARNTGTRRRMHRPLSRKIGGS